MIFLLQSKHLRKEPKLFINMKILTENQIFVLVTLENRGAPMVANSIRNSWENGETNYIDSRVKAGKGLKRKMNQGNNEALGIFKY